MRRVSLGLVVLAAACATEPTDTGDEAPYVAPLAPPWVAITASTFDGAFRSTCTMAGSVRDSGGNEIATLSMDPADGGLWAGTAVAPDTQLKLVMSWNDCVNNDNGTGEFESSTFSGGDGDLFVAHYNGSTKGFEWMVQATDHVGGEIHVQFDKNAMGKEIDAVAESLDVLSEPDDADETFRYFSWTDTRSVVEVLDALRAEPLFLWGEPTWVAQPSWW